MSYMSDILSEIKWYFNGNKFKNVHHLVLCPEPIYRKYCT